jgi:tetratricopeptide (TPR) repeat protein
MLTHPLYRIRVLLLFAFLPLAGCGEEQGGASGDERSVSTPAAERTFERNDSPELCELRSALDLGDLPRAEELIREHADSLPTEGDLLRARAEAQQGRDLQVARLIEEARGRSPEDPRVWATAAELHAASGRLETARDEIRRGVDRCGLTPELMRAQALVQLCQQGGAERGMDLLRRAKSYDPDLPFTARATSQAYLLIGRRALAERRSTRALECARSAVEADRTDPDVRLFLADTLAATADFEGAVAVLEELQSEGGERGGELASMHKRAGMASLLKHRREEALEHFVKARSAGLDDEALGSGAQFLADAAMEELSEGTIAFEAGELEAARVHFERGIRYDDEILVLHNHLAVVLFRQGKFLPAATQWRRVLDTSIEEGLDLPDPVHLFLAKAFLAAGEISAAEKVLEGYLARDPEGEWGEETRGLLGELE